MIRALYIERDYESYLRGPILNKSLIQIEGQPVPDRGEDTFLVSKAMVIRMKVNRGTIVDSS